ncbi:MAG: ShlB/FhaC/HecB family hemolysin secretion/activation protein, partial [Alphaproteobacteria bacterium]
PLIIDPTGRSGEAPPLQKEEPRTTPQPGLILPPVPSAPTREERRLPVQRVFIRKIHVTGSTVFSAQELAQITAPYENRELGFEDLEAVRLALTVQYVNRGYINSGAVIPDQTVSDGTVTLAVIEGELSRIELEQNRWFRDSYIRDRLMRGIVRPFDINVLQQRMQLLLQDERFERLNATLRPGVKLGESILDVIVEERRPYRLTLEYNNFESPTVGANQGLTIFEHQNVFGFGDTFRIEHGGSKGIYPQLDVRYTFPFTAVDTSLSFNYRKNDTVVVEAPFNPLDIKNRSEIFGFTLRQPFHWMLSDEFAFEITGERLENKSYLLGRPFSFSPGAENGKSVVTALRFAQEWIRRSGVQILAARSRFSFGLDALGSTINSSGQPDSKFFVWLGQFQWARRWAPLGIETIFRIDTQFSHDPLFPLEQIAVGGRYSVRGYRENTLVRDSAALSSFEARIPLISGVPWADYIQLAPFYDFGHAWNRSEPTPDPRTIYSVGVGVRWAATFNKTMQIRPQFEIYWGKPLKKVPTPGGDLQDHGLHLRFALELF